MSLFASVLKKSGVAASLSLIGGLAVAASPFQNDVATSIDRGIEWLANNGGFAGGHGDATGLTTQALLEKRASGNPADPPQGYAGASATDKTRLRAAALYMINQTNGNGTGFYSYRDGQRMFALAGYALTAGPDKSVLGSTITLKAAMDKLVDRTLANQNAAGYWCYTDGFCNDSSTTQFAAAGLHAARTFYLSPASGDVAFADPARAALIDTALAKTRAGYETNALVGSDYGTTVGGNCQVMNATERGHGYNAQSYRPSLAQTASGVYIQQFGGSTVNSPMVQAYMQWLKNRYRYTDLDSLGNSWPTLTWSYYMWSSFKGMELLRQSGVAVAPGNIGPNDMGTLPAGTAAANDCAVRQANVAPATVARAASFGAGGVGYYSAETKSQYFDYAQRILSLQCFDGTLPVNGNDGGYFCNGSPSYWNSYAHQAYLLLVLQRSTGNVVLACDVNGDQKVDTSDLNLIRAGIGQPPVSGDPRDANLDGKITINDVRFCTAKCTNAGCAP